MSMLPEIDGDRWSQGMSTERYHPWHGHHLNDAPVPGAEDLAGMAAVITLHGPAGGMTYEQCENVNGKHYRGKSSGPIPYTVRQA